MTWKRRNRSRGMQEASEVAVSDGEAAPELPEAGVKGTMHAMCSFSPITWGKHHKRSVSNAVQAGTQDMHMIRLSAVHVYMAAPQTSDSSASNNSEDLLDTGIVWNCWKLYILPLALRS